MRPPIFDPDEIAVLQQEVQRSEEAKYDHRLHAVLLVAQGLSSRESADLLGDSPRSVAYWVQRFRRDGSAGLQEGDHPGRTRRLTPEQMVSVAKILRSPARHAGMEVNLWDGKSLSAWIEREHGVALGVRQCQRLFRHLDFRLRKPRPVLAKADPARQQQAKKNFAK